MLIGQAEEVLCPPGPFSFLTPRGGGGRWTSLHESTSVCPPLVISSHPHAQTLPPTYSALSLCSLHFPNTHTQAQDYYLALPILTSTTTNIIFFLHYPHQQHKITFLLDTDTVKIIALFTIGSDPFLYLETICVNMFSLCVCICDLCMYVGEVYKCICVCV